LARAAQHRPIDAGRVDEVRIGVLGAAKVTPTALLKPARKVPQVRVVAVAARDRVRATRYAARHGIDVVHDSYDSLIDDPDLDAVYVPLVNSLHAAWTLRAVAAGKHVLCEKPFAVNAAQARAVARVAAGSGLVVMEGLHYRYHPLAERMRELSHGGTLGEICRIETSCCYPMPAFGNFAYRYELGGGSLMDAGCYAVHFLRTLGAGEPAVLSATAKLKRPEVDRAMTARLRFPGGATGTVTCSLWSSRWLSFRARVVGTEGELKVNNYMVPHLYHRLTLRRGRWVQRTRVPGGPTHEHQLRAFAAAVLRGDPPVVTPPEDAVANLEVIDRIYEAAGLRPRGLP
jgi:predicted dehydrogenase